MRVASGLLALIAAIVLSAVAIGMPLLGYDDVDGGDSPAADEIRDAAGEKTGFDQFLVSQVRSLLTGGPEGTVGVVSYRTLFGVELLRYEVNNGDTTALLDRAWVGIWLWLAFLGAEIALISYAIWRLTERRSNASRSEDAETATV